MRRHPGFYFLERVLSE